MNVSDFPPAAMDAKISWIEDESVKAGRSNNGCTGAELDDVGISFLGPRQHRLVLDEQRGAPDLALHFIGDTPALIDGLHERRERWGFSYFVCFDHEIDRIFTVVQKLANRPM